jgi:hypothetical protein
MPAPIIAALLRAAASSGMGGAASRVGSASSYLSRAQAATAARGGNWREAMRAAGGNKDLAREMINQRNQDIQEQARQDRKAAMEHERSQSFISRLKRDPMNTLADEAVKSINQHTRIMNDDYRGYAISAMNQVPLVGAPAAKLLDAFGKLTDAINGQTLALSPYSGELARSSAMAKVRQMQADIHEARRNGRAYGRVTDESSKLQTDLQKAFTPVKEEIANGMGSLLKFLNDNKPVIELFANILASNLRAINTGVNVGVEAAKTLMPVPRMIAAFLEQNKGKDENFLEDIWDNLRLDLPDANQPARPPLDAGIGIPLFEGM